MMLLALLLYVAQASDYAGDPRIRSIAYDSAVVIDLDITPGFATVVEFADNETVMNVVLGNGDAWQVSSSSKGSQMVVKPLGGAAMTNMIVTTDRRRYAFALASQGSQQPAFVVHFTYADERTPKTDARAAGPYVFQGSREITPIDMRDDGKSTSIRWREEQAIPAVFAVRDDKQEVLVNGRMVGQQYVVDATADKFLFKLGNARVIASRRSEKKNR